MAESNIMGLFANPEDIRQKQRERLLNEGRQSAGMLMQGGGSGLSQAIKGYGANVAQYIPVQADRMKRGLMGAAAEVAGLQGNEEGRRAIQMASMSPQEQQAAKTQQLLSSVDTSDPQSIAKGVAAAQQAGLPKVVEFLKGKAASLASADRAKEIEDRNYALEYAKTQSQLGVDNAKIKKTLAEADKLDKTTPLEVRIKSVEAGIAEATMSDEVKKVKADLQATIVDTQLAGAQKMQLNQSIEQASQMFPVEMEEALAGLDKTRATTALTQAQTTSEEALRPEKVKQIVAQSKLLGYQVEATKALTDQRKAQMENMNQTDFLRELNSLNISEEERQQLIADRVATRSSTGDVKQFDPNDDISKMRLEQAQKIAEKGAEAVSNLERTENIIVALDRAATGKFAGPEAFIKSWMGQLGFEDAQRDTVANELYQVLRGEVTLEAAGNLKGALSDKDLAFLERTIPARDMSVQGLRSIFGAMAAESAADVAAAQAMDKFITSTDSQQLRGAPINNIETAFKTQARTMYLLELKRQGRLTEDFVIKMPTEEQRALIKKYGG